MKHLIILIIISFNATAQIMWQVTTENSKKWYLQDHDEFSDADTTFKYWKSGFPWSPHVMGLDLIYKPENLLFNNGILTISTKKEKTTSRVFEWDIDKTYLQKNGKVLGPNNEYTFDYSSGALTTKKAYKYGYFEIRFMANKEQGTWPAFWLYGGNPNEEIDFYEGKGELENQIHLDVHCPNGCENFRGGFLKLQRNWGAWIKTNEKLSEGWNIISGEWQENYVKFFLNGQPMGYFEGEFKTAQQLFINTSVAKDGGAFKPGPKENALWPDNFNIDYVRIWSQQDSIKNLQNNGINQFMNSQENVTNNDLYSTSMKAKVGFIYNKKALNKELGTVTLLPLSANKYSISIVGKSITASIKIELYNTKNEKIVDNTFTQTEYQLLDFSSLQSGSYRIEITVLNQTLSHQIDIINTQK